METRENRIKKMQYRAWYRGCRETDKILGNFAREKLNDFSDEQLDQFEEILELQDVDIYDWISGKRPTPKEILDNPIFRKMLEYKLV